MSLISILFCIPVVIGIGMLVVVIAVGDPVKKRRNIMTSTAIATFKGRKTNLPLNVDEHASYDLEYEFYAPEDCCNHIVSSEHFIPFLMVSKRQKRPVRVCYDPNHPTTNAIINENGKIIRRPYQIVFFILALLFIAFSVFLCVIFSNKI